MAEDFETLLSVEIKLRLLDTEGVDISKDAPEIPPEPEVTQIFNLICRHIKSFFLISRTMNLILKAEKVGSCQHVNLLMPKQFYFIFSLRQQHKVVSE